VNFDQARNSHEPRTVPMPFAWNLQQKKKREHLLVIILFLDRSLLQLTRFK
jgi:hypothetical protein